MGISIGNSEISTATGIYCGSRKLRPGEMPPFVPGENTVLYMPLKSDLLDHGPNNISLTKSGTISVDSTGALFSTGNLIGQTPSTITGDFTMNVWIKPSSCGNDGNLVLIGEVYPNYGYRYGANSSGKIGFSVNRVYDWNYGTAFSTLYGGWHNIVFTRSGTTNTLYLDNVSKGSYTGTSSPSSKNITIGGFGGASTYIDGYMSNVIVEDKARTADEISTYYLASKADYGL